MHPQGRIDLHFHPQAGFVIMIIVMLFLYYGGVSGPGFLVLLLPLDYIM